MQEFTRLCCQIGLPDPELGELLGVTFETLSRYRSGVERPSTREVQILKGMALCSSSRHAKLSCDSDDHMSADQDRTAAEFTQASAESHGMPVESRNQVGSALNLDRLKTRSICGTIQQPNAEPEADVSPEWMKDATSLRVVDAFSGAGGFSVGFSQAGFKVVGAIEIDTWAADTFATNHTQASVLNRDIASLTDEELTDAFSGDAPDILLGGPPCQGFSVCVRNNGDPHDPRNSMFREFLRLARLFGPRMVVMENVPNIVKARTKTGHLVTNIIENELRELGYHVYSTILEAISFGVPQIRKRYFMIASKRRLHRPFPKPTHAPLHGCDNSLPFSSELEPCPTLWEAISDLPQLAAGEGDEVSPYTDDPRTPYQRAMRGTSRVLYNHTAMRHTPRMIERFRAMSWGVPVSELPKHLWPRRRNSEEIAEVVYDQNNRRLFPHRPCHTLPASFYANFVHPYCHRNFTPREGARIQSFPDSFVFKGKPTVCSHKLLAREGRTDELHLCQYNQIGNGVPPLLARAIATNLLAQI